MKKTITDEQNLGYRFADLARYMSTGTSQSLLRLITFHVAAKHGQEAFDDLTDGISSGMEFWDNRKAEIFESESYKYQARGIQLLGDDQYFELEGNPYSIKIALESLHLPMNIPEVLAAKTHSETKLLHRNILDHALAIIGLSLGPKWTQSVIERLPGLSANHLSSIKSEIKLICAHFFRRVYEPSPDYGLHRVSIATELASELLSRYASEEKIIDELSFSNVQIRNSEIEPLSLNCYRTNSPFDLGETHKKEYSAGSSMAVTYSILNPEIVPYLMNVISAHMMHHGAEQYFAFTRGLYARLEHLGAKLTIEKLLEQENDRQAHVEGTHSTGVCPVCSAHDSLSTAFELARKNLFSDQVYQKLMCESHHGPVISQLIDVGFEGFLTHLWLTLNANQSTELIASCQALTRKQAAELSANTYRACESIGNEMLLQLEEVYNSREECYDEAATVVIRAYNNLGSNSAKSPNTKSKLKLANYTFRTKIENDSENDLSEPHELIKKIRTSIIESDSDIEIGFVCFELLFIGSNGYDHDATFNHSYTTEVFGALYNERKVWFEDESDYSYCELSDSLLIIDEANIEPAHRGNNLTLLSLINLIDLMALYDAKIALEPFPAQIHHPDTEHPFDGDSIDSFKAIYTYLTTIGFRQATRVDSAIWVSDYNSLSPAFKNSKRVVVDG